MQENTALHHACTWAELKIEVEKVLGKKETPVEEVDSDADTLPLPSQDPAASSLDEQPSKKRRHG